jgi:dynein heavy chain
VFADKLINTTDRDLVSKQTINELITSNFPNQAELIMKEPCLIGDFMLASPAEPEKINPEIYQDCGDYEVVGKKFEKILLDYNDEDGNLEMNLVLFKGNSLNKNDFLKKNFTKNFLH